MQYAYSNYYRNGVKFLTEYPKVHTRETPKFTTPEYDALWASNNVSEHKLRKRIRRESKIVGLLESWRETIELHIPAINGPIKLYAPVPNTPYTLDMLIQFDGAIIAMIDNRIKGYQDNVALAVLRAVTCGIGPKQLTEHYSKPARDLAKFICERVSTYPQFQPY